MRTKQITLYTIDELDDDARERAIDSLRGTDLDWCEEWRESLRAFCDLLGIDEPHWSDERGQLFHYREDRRHWHEVMRGRSLSEFTRENYPTGYCADADLSVAFYDEWKRTGSPVDAVDAAFHAFFCAWRADIEYQQSDEYLAELAAINEWEFTATGQPA